MKIEKTIRILTLAPALAFVSLTILWFAKVQVFGTILNYIIAVLCFTIMPLLAYPLQPVIKSFKNKGRDGQRKLAIIMAVIGYILGIILALCMKVSKLLLVTYLTYLISGLLIMFFNKVIKIKASGHACGVVGPVALLVYVFGVWGLFGVIVMGLVYWASLRMKRHTVRELIIGSIIPVVAFLVSLLSVGLI